MGLLRNPEYLVALIPALLIALTFHEYAHARVALAFGDRTAERAGRLTLNPISHLDPIGTLMILLVGFGWARPVPINPYSFSDYRRGLLWVSLAGPLTNFALAFISMFIMSLMIGMGVMNDIFILLMTTLVHLNVILGLFNLLPIPPLDGSKIVTSLVPDSAMGLYQRIEAYAPIILIALIILGVLGAVLWPLTRIILGAFDLVISMVTGVSLSPFFIF